jgi:hypothetical protein
MQISKSFLDFHFNFSFIHFIWLTISKFKIENNLYVLQNHGFTLFLVIDFSHIFSHNGH